MTQTVDEFHKIFGPELMAVTGDTDQINSVIERVDRLVLDIEIIKFDPFSPSNKYVIFLGLRIICNVFHSNLPVGMCDSLVTHKLCL